MADNGKRKPIPLGPTGRRVAENVAWFRSQQHLTYAELSRRLTALGRPIAVLGLSRIEQGERRIDVDDLVALALALGVGPNKLLFYGEHGDGPVQITPDTAMTGSELWEWAGHLHSVPLLGRSIDLTGILAREVLVGRGFDVPPGCAYTINIQPNGAVDIAAHPPQSEDSDDER